MSNTIAVRKLVAHGCAIYTEDAWQNGKNYGGKLVATTVVQPEDECLEDSQLELATLLASAPALLEALEELIAVVPLEFVTVKAGAAIAAARGTDSPE